LPAPLVKEVNEALGNPKIQITGLARALKKRGYAEINRGRLSHHKNEGHARA
jgi:hypothetical protein